MTIERATPDPRPLSPVALVDPSDEEVIAQPGDSQRLLALAESLQRRLNELSSHRLRLFVGLVVSFAIWIFLLGFLLSIWSSLSSAKAVAISLSFLLIGSLAIGSEYVVYGRVQRAFVRLRRSLLEVLTLLRESEPTLAVQEHWSAMQRAEFRIRLSQFDVAP